MPIRRWRAPAPRSPFAPNWEVPLYLEQFNDRAALAEIRDLILAREQALRSEIPARPIAGIDDGLTSRWHGFNLFRWDEPCIQRFQSFVRDSYGALLRELGAPHPRCFIHSWANVVRTGERLTAHCHDQSPFSYLSGNFCVTDQPTSTIFYPPYLYQGAPNPETSIAVANQAGMLTMFPSSIMHETSVHEGPVERITLAFDIVLQDVDASGVAGEAGAHVLFDAPEPVH